MYLSSVAGDAAEACAAGGTTPLDCELIVGTADFFGVSPTKSPTGPLARAAAIAMSHTRNAQPNHAIWRVLPRVSGIFCSCTRGQSAKDGRGGPTCRRATFIPCRTERVLLCGGHVYSSLRQMPDSRRGFI